jgi:hypothetical protein
VLTGADTLALEGLAEALADLRAARSSLASRLEFDGKIVAETGSRFYWTVGKSGPMRRPRPELAAISDADRRVSVWLARFGFSPADRSKVTAASGEPANPFAALEA